MSTGRRQVVEQDRTQAISVRLVEDGIATTLDASGHFVTIYNQGSGELVARTGVGLSRDASDLTVANYLRSWGSGTFSRRRGFRAEFELEAGGVTYYRAARFDVVRRRFLSQLSDDDISTAFPRLAAQLPAGVSTFKAWRDQAWYYIEETIRKRWSSRPGQSEGTSTDLALATNEINPGAVFYPEDFFDAHLWISAGFFYNQNSFDTAPGGEDWEKYKDAMDRGNAYMERALDSIDLDLDDDARYDDDEQGLNVGIEVVR